MNNNLTDELKQILWACYIECKGDDNQEICYKHIKEVYKDKYDDFFYWRLLNKLEEMGYLKYISSTHGKSRRNYKLINPTELANQLKEWGFDIIH